MALERLESTAHELCRRYACTPAATLRNEAQKLIHEAADCSTVRSTCGNAARSWPRPDGSRCSPLLRVRHGMRRAAESTRRTALELAKESGHREQIGWAAEMGAWFALTQGRYT